MKTTLTRCWICGRTHEEVRDAIKEHWNSHPVEHQEKMATLFAGDQKHRTGEWKTIEKEIPEEYNSYELVLNVCPICQALIKTIVKDMHMHLAFNEERECD